MCVCALCFVSFFFFFFFFQAEDGIRDVAVTGVQTCALPICRGRFQAPRGDGLGATPLARSDPARRARCPSGLTCSASCTSCRVRSEEHTSELQSRLHLVCRLLLEKKNKKFGSTCTAHIIKDNL